MSERKKTVVSEMDFRGGCCQRSFLNTATKKRLDATRHEPPVKSFAKETKRKKQILCLYKCPARYEQPVRESVSNVHDTNSGNLHVLIPKIHKQMTQK